MIDIKKQLGVFFVRFLFLVMIVQFLFLNFLLYHIYVYVIDQSTHFLILVYKRTTNILLSCFFCFSIFCSVNNIIHNFASK